MKIKYLSKDNGELQIIHQVRRARVKKDIIHYKLMDSKTGKLYLQDPLSWEIELVPNEDEQLKLRCRSGKEMKEYSITHICMEILKEKQVLCYESAKRKDGQKYRINNSYNWEVISTLQKRN